MNAAWRRLWWIGMAGLGAASAFALDSPWTNELRTLTFYEGDAYGTVVHDIYIDFSNVFQTVNFNGQGLRLHWAGGEPERPGFIRFENWTNRIPAGSFIYRADLVLVSRANSALPNAFLMIGVRGNSGFNEATAAYAAGGGNIALANRTQVAPDAVAAFNKSVLYSHPFLATLTDGSVVTACVSSAARAWFDYYQNASWGFPNQGFCLNINNQGSGYDGGSVEFYDSENADPAKRPRLVVQYLPPTAQYAMRLYQAAPTNTAQICKVTAEDALIRKSDWNNQIWNLHTNNYGGAPGPLLVWEMDGYGQGAVPDGHGALCIRWRGLSYPDNVVRVVDAKLRLNGSSTWNPYDNSGTFRVRKILRDWVEGTGTVATPGYTNVTWTNFNAVAGDPSLNKWEHTGATGETDSVFLFNLPVSNDRGEILGSDANGWLAALARDWLGGVGNNNGLLLSAVSGGFIMQIGNYEPSGNYQKDPYQTAGLLMVFLKARGTVITIR